MLLMLRLTPVTQGKNSSVFKLFYIIDRLFLQFEHLWLLVYYFVFLTFSACALYGFNLHRVVFCFSFTNLVAARTSLSLSK